MSHRYLLHGLCFTAPFFLSAQAPVVEWQRCIGGNYVDFGGLIRATDDGGHITASYTESQDVVGYSGQGDILVVKLDSAGGIEWQKALGGEGPEFVYALELTVDNGFLIAGTTASYDVPGMHGGTDLWVVKLNAAGTIQWQKCLGGQGEQFYALSFHDIRAEPLLMTPDDGCVLLGITSSAGGDVTTHHGSYDIWLVRLDPSGELLWERSFGGSERDEAYTLKWTLDGDLIIGGRTMSADGDVTGFHMGIAPDPLADLWVMKLNGEGDLLWQKALGGTEEEVDPSAYPTPDGGYVACCRTNSADGDVTGFHGVNDWWVVKLDADGGLVWERALGGTDFEWVPRLGLVPDGYIISGHSSSVDGDITAHYDPNYPDYWVVKLTLTGALAWEKSLGGNYLDYAQCLCITPDGGCTVGGLTVSTDGDVTEWYGITDYWLAHLNADGELQWTKALGGSDVEGHTQETWGLTLTQTTDGDYLLSGRTFSNDGDVSGHMGNSDAWYVRLSGGIGQSTPEVSKNSGARIYLDPVGNSVMVEVTPELHNARLTLTNVLGQVILVDRMQGARHSIALAGMPRGLYTLSLRTPLGQEAYPLLLE